MYLSLYIEINILCLALLTIIYMRIRKQRVTLSTAQITMLQLLYAVYALCIADIGAILCRGRFFPGARAAIEFFNLLYLEMMPLISILWYRYVRLKVGKTITARRLFFNLIPLIIYTVFTVTNPFTNFLFSVSSENLYSRGPGILLHWVVSLLYLISAGILAARALKNAPTRQKRSEYRPLLHFLVIPTLGCIIQMSFYGMTSVQAGITISLIMLIMQTQDNQISADELTGINNRKAMRLYMENLLRRSSPVSITAMMIDLNKFKHINDTLGHAIGDDALCTTAEILKSVCDSIGRPMFLCRYGGDEFVIICRDFEENEPEFLVELIQASIIGYTAEHSIPYALDVSIGYASSECSSYEDFKKCLSEADSSMYSLKSGN